MTQACFHCGLPVPIEPDLQVKIQGEPRAMCCHGCQAVAEAIVAGGLESFYSHRTATSRRPEDLIPAQLERLSMYDREIVQRSFVTVAEGDRRRASLILEGITCAACVWLNERHVRRLPGILTFDVNLSNHRARVEWDATQIQLSDILRAIAAIGYIAHPFDPGKQEEIHRREKRIALRKLAIAGVAAMQVMMLAVALYAGDYSGMDADLQHFMRWVSLVLTVPVVFYSATSFFKNAWRDIQRRQASMDLPVAIAIGGAFLASVWMTLTGGHEVYFDSVCMFAFFLLSTRYLEMGARHRAGEAAEALVRLLPATATRLSSDGAEDIVSVADLRAGDEVLIRPGEVVPADGLVVTGVSSLDESLLSGESLPLLRHPGDPLVGGTLNIESPLVMRIEKVGEDTVVSSIGRLLERAQMEKPRIAYYADLIAGWFVVGLLMLASLVAIWWWFHDPMRAFAITLSVLVVTCPCALSLATPLAITAATGSLTRLGLLATRGHAIETLAKVTDIVFDKTGTLTKGQLRVLDLELLGTQGLTAVLAIAATLEQQSEHPVAKAIGAQATDRVAMTDIVATPGMGVQGYYAGQHYRIGNLQFVSALSSSKVAVNASNRTSVYLGNDTELLTRFDLGDELRPDAATMLVALRNLGISVHLLSGDAQGPVMAVAQELGITQAVFAASPTDKLAYVRQLQDKGAIVAMVGDGVNDAPVLAGANVSIAMGGGTELAHAAADLVILSDHLHYLVAGLQMARRTLGIIRQNLGMSLAYNMSALPLAAAGFIAPWMAALGMSASSLVVVVNALRLRKVDALRAKS